MSSTPASGKLVPEAASVSPMPPPPTWKIVTVVSGIVFATAAVVVTLWWAGTAGLNGDKLVTARLDALRTGLSIGIGGGGSLALYLSWRRQRAAEITLTQAAIALKQKDRDHDHTEADARERRITDLYTKAVEQLGSDKAPVRLGGLYALERLAADNPPQRQTIVNVLCAYLRMPYTLAGAQPEDDAETALLDLHRERVQELEVRLTAQRILSYRLRAGIELNNPEKEFWPDIDVDLSNAVLVKFSLNLAYIRNADFSGAHFVDGGHFHQARFSGDVNFKDTRFLGVARFEEAQFYGVANFSRVKFSSAGAFHGSNFGRNAYFGFAEFSGTAFFSGAAFGDLASFRGARFKGPTQFSAVRFGNPPDFESAQFGEKEPEVVVRYIQRAGYVVPPAFGMNDDDNAVW